LGFSAKLARDDGYFVLDGISNRRRQGRSPGRFGAGLRKIHRAVTYLRFKIQVGFLATVGQRSSVVKLLLSNVDAGFCAWSHVVTQASTSLVGGQITTRRAEPEVVGVAQPDNRFASRA